MENIRELIFKKALSNAYKHQGKASKEAVIRKVIFVKPELKSRIREILAIVDEVIEEVNSLSLEEQYNYLLVKYPDELKEEKIEEKKELPPLEEAEPGKVVTRFAPNPDGPLHIGNVRAMILSHEYARMYKGKFILRFEDTDPRIKKPLLHIYEDEKNDYEYIIKDLHWLGCYPDEIYIQSDRLKIYYDFAREFIKRGLLYSCFCNEEEIRKNRMLGLECIHRNRDPEESLKDFEEMIEGKLKKGVLRVKTDLKHPDPSVRDWIAFRIIDPKVYPHPRLETISSSLGHLPYLWPTYNFASSLDDHLMGVTHIFRAKEHMGNTVKQAFIYEGMVWKKPIVIHYGRIKFENVVLSKSKIIEGIKKNKFEGFDDVDLATISAFRRRGFLPKSIKDLILSMGIKPTEARISFENLHALNRKLIDPIVNRYFFVSKPVKVKLKMEESIKVKRQLHPSRKEFFEYELIPKDGYVEVFLDEPDLEENLEVRLIELGNFRIFKEGDSYIGIQLEDNSLEYSRRRKLKLIQWIYEGYSIDCEIKVPSYIIPSKKIHGKAEFEIAKLEPNTSLQFIRYFFAKLDSISDTKAILFYLHQ